MNKRMEILQLIEKNSHLSTAEIAVMTDLTEDEVKAEIRAMEKEKVICGYHTIINWDKVDEELVTALIELKVTPQSGDGYQELARRICDYPQVESIYLMSGVYDFMVTVKGQTLREISMFVNEKLASIPEVQSTSTHFTLVKYKDHGTNLLMSKKDERMVMF